MATEAAGTGARAVHEARRAELCADEATLTARSDRISTLRGVTFLGATGGGLAVWFTGAPRPLFAGAAAIGVAFVVLVVRHALLVTRAAELSLRRGVVERAIARIDHAWAEAALRRPGSAKAAREVDSTSSRPGVGPDRGELAAHPYAVDLDVFGEASLFRLVSTAHTADGERRVASWLLEPATLEVARARQAAARELAGKVRLREDIEHLAVEARTAGMERDPLVGWIEDAPRTTPLHEVPIARFGRWLTLVAIAAFAASALAPAGAPLLGRAWVLPVLGQLALLAATRRSITSALALLRARDAPFAAYLALVRRIEAERFEAPALVAARDALEGAGAALGRLARALSFAEVRHNALAAIVANGLFAWDLHAAIALERWRSEEGPRVAAWVSAIAEIEALASLGALTHDHPDLTFPKLAEGGPSFHARALGHPMLRDDKRVTNDVAIGGDDAPRALLVTGSNMSGKSTLLRAIGVNAALALAGAPCCAAELELSRVRVWTSMRVTDSLESGVSHFYAELARLKAVVDAKDAGEPVLFLLDEVMHGTNSRERRIGAKAVALHLVAGEAHAIGALSSHDLGLGDLEAESAGAVVAVHFEEQVEGDAMTFDYRMRPGVVRSGNALLLMRSLGLPV